MPGPLIQKPQMPNWMPGWLQDALNSASLNPVSTAIPVAGAAAPLLEAGEAAAASKVPAALQGLKSAGARIGNIWNEVRPQFTSEPVEWGKLDPAVRSPVKK